MAAVSTWNSFSYYSVGSIVSYTGIQYRALQRNIDVVPDTLLPNWELLNTPSSQTITSLNSMVSNVTLVSPDATFTPDQLTGDLTMVITGGGGGGVSSLNDVVSAVVLTSPDTSIGITPNGQNIELTANFPAVVSSLQSLNGAITLTSSNSSVGINPTLTNEIDITVVPPIVYSVIAGQGIAVAGDPTFTIATILETDSLLNKVESVSSTDVTSVPLTWSASSTANQYVPLSDALALPPTTATLGWRLTKAAPILATAMVSGSTYTIVQSGTTNWTAIGFASTAVGTQGTYNGGARTGANGYATPSTNYGTYISWYSLNALYGLSLPQTIVPATTVLKKDLNAVWALIRFNNDVAVQGSISITVETYAYQYGSNTTNAYTGRWAYSFPMAAIVGGGVYPWSATGGVALTATTPRAVGGFTYLLYCEDKYPKVIPNTVPPSLSFAVSNGMFPSQSTSTNTCRDPYDVYPHYPHLPLNGVQYTENAVQPTYGGVYADQASVEVASIYVHSTSSPQTPLVLQPSFDFQVLDMGYRGTNGAGTQGGNFVLSYV